MFFPENFRNYIIITENILEKSPDMKIIVQDVFFLFEKMWIWNYIFST